MESVSGFQEITLNEMYSVDGGWSWKSLVKSYASPACGSVGAAVGMAVGGLPVAFFGGFVGATAGGIVAYYI